ncbi:uncharacterized protein LOC131035561 [Cryptomeria japonica]|uniref:uncharacterized protein LOC131035561 n=1 Tax=Cryptomeria japonica TaxID=3369 RepID=UPI0025AD1799|nr:uncharacterized protein LOC131035561 [Cryptomeria japonica]XP_057823258.1 uncharacterized protein LOC131035561 [Cryptomeria japonica]XP_057823259.1 uncharacterized protein LOC131035561 [Cryptomeria japonica]XP_057823260.1 uncharacterized protein LOC131035561 [Cryptomeria japonica]
MTTPEGVDSGKVHEPGKPMNGKASIGSKPDNQITKPMVASNSPQKLTPATLPTHLRKSPNELDKVAKISNGSKGTTPTAVADVSLAVAPTTPPTHFKISSNGLEKAAKIYNGSKNPSPSDEASKHIPHYLRPSTASCHHYCKYGVKPEKPQSKRYDSSKHQHNHTTSANKTPLDTPKSAAAKTPKGHKSISDTPSPVKHSTPVKSPSTPTGISSTPGHSSKVSPKEKTAVNKSEFQSKVIRSTALKSKTSPSLPSKSSSEKNIKASVSPKPVINGNSKANLVSSSPSQALNDHENAKKAIQSQNHALNIHGSAKKATPPPKYALDGHSNAKTKKPVLKTIEKSLKRREKNGAVKSDSPRSQSQNSSSDPQHERPDRDGTVEVCSYKEGLPATDQICANDAEDAHQTVEACSDKEELPANDQICANDAEDAHQFDEHSHSADETSEEHADTMEHIDTEGDGQSVEEYCHECSDRNDAPISAPYEIIDSHKFVDEKNDDFEPHEEKIDEYQPYGESIAEEYIDEDFDSEYSEDFEYDDSYGSESNGEQEGLGKVRKQHQTTVPQEGNQILEKGRFRRGQIIAGSEEDNRRLEKRRFRRGRIIDSSNPKSKPENVNLRHQELQARKASEEWMLNHVIEKEVNKLAPVRKSKVKTLVGAFETVIQLKESEIGEPKHAGIKDVSQVSPPNECN